MQAGDLVIFDVGCELDDYSSDVGRTFPVFGTFGPEQKQILEMVTAVADAVIAATRPGTSHGLPRSPRGLERLMRGVNAP